MNRLKKNKTPETTKIQTAPTDEGGANGIDPLAIQESKKIDEYRARANAGDAEAQNRLGYFYYHGVGVAEDKTEAAKWFRKSAEQGYLKGQKNLALCYSDGTGVEPNAEETIKWLTAAAEQGDLDCQLDLARIYEGIFEASCKRVDGGDKFVEMSREKFEKRILEEGPDPLTGKKPERKPKREIRETEESDEKFDKSLEELEVKSEESQGEAAPKGDADAKPADDSDFDLDEFFESFGKEEKEDEGEDADLHLSNGPESLVNAAKWYGRAAKQGSIEAKGKFGWHCLHNMGVQGNEEKGEQLLLEAAEQGHLPSQIDLAFDYLYGLSVPPDFGKALKWLHEAAKNGDHGCQETYGRLRVENRRCQADVDEGERWLEIAMKNGNVNAIMDLAVLYDERDFDPVKAAKYYEMAAERGHCLAQFSIGQCYRRGEGVPMDPQKAVYWYRKAAEQNVSEAQCNLGQCYHDGNGVEKDEVQSVYWLVQAAARDMTYAYRPLGWHYLFGVGIEKNITIGLTLLRMAIQCGDEAAIPTYLSFRGVLRLLRENEKHE